MKAYYCDTFVLALPPRHRFPMAKYRLLRQAILDHPELSRRLQLRIPPAASDEEILLVHHPHYLAGLKDGTLCPKIQRRIGFPYSPGMLERSRRSVGATLAACRAALQDGVAVNLAGGTQHSFSDCGEGFCVLNDAAVALRVLQKERLIVRALVIDTDVHQGNGTAAIFADDSSVFTFSIHGEKNFPFKKERSDLDVALADGTSDVAYLEALFEALSQLENVPAEMVIFQSGADPYEEDKLGRLALSKAGLKERDRMVLNWCRQRGLPVAVTMGGGYAPEVADIVAIHLQTIMETLSVYSRSLNPSSSDS